MSRTTVCILATIATFVEGLSCRLGDPGREPLNILTAEAIFSDDSLGWVVDMKLVGSRIVAIDAMLDPAIHVVDSKRLRRLGAYGRKGDGPGEFKDPDHIVTEAADSREEVWILDGIHQRLTLVSLGQIEAGTVHAPETSQMDGPNAGSLVRAPDGRWFGGGWITGGRVARYNADRSYDRTILGFPSEAGEAPGTTLPQAYESWVVADPAGERLAAATLLGGLLEIFDYDGVLIAQAAVPEPFQPAWVQGRSRSGRAVLSVGPETRYGFSDLAATRGYLYGLFSGNQLMEDGTPWATTEVQVFTWDGEHVKTLHLDRAAETIAIDASDTWLYATGPDPRPWLARYRLPES